MHVYESTIQNVFRFLRPPADKIKIQNNQIKSEEFRKKTDDFNLRQTDRALDSDVSVRMRTRLLEPKEKQHKVGILQRHFHHVHSDGILKYRF